MSLRDSAIVAYAETKVMEKSDRDVWELGGEILEALLDKTGLDKNEIDARHGGLEQHRRREHVLGADHGGRARTGARFLRAGAHRRMLGGGLGGARRRRDRRRVLHRGAAALCRYRVAEPNARDRSYRREWTEPYGLMGPPGSFGLLSRRYEAQYGLDYEMLGKLAVTQRAHAVLNENACEKLRKPITIEDYMNSRMIADPIRLLDCVMPADGAAGLVMMSAKRAKEKGLSKRIIPIGYGERTNYRAGESLVEVAHTGHEAAGRKAFAQAGMTLKDVASLHFYDDFIIALMLQLENLGFCKTGEGCGFIRDNDFSYRGNLPLNTGGGQISAGQAACSSHNLIEAVRQLMGEGGTRQVRNTSNALVTGIGWINYARNWGTSAALLLVPDA